MREGSYEGMFVESNVYISHDNLLRIDQTRFVADMNVHYKLICLHGEIFKSILDRF